MPFEMVYAIVVLCVLSSYAAVVFWLSLAWQVPREQPIKGEKVGLSVIVPFRNESSTIANLLKDLSHQRYPKQRVEVVFVDDHSTDDGLAKLTQLVSETSNLPFQILVLNARETGKKAALHKGITAAKFDILITLDADVRLPENLFESYNYHFSSHQTQLVAGSVVMQGGPGFLGDFVNMEFLSLMGVGGSLIHHQLPVLCNGANLAFRKHAFHAVGGYSKHQEIASGDDVFLMHAIAKQFGAASIAFATLPPVIATSPTNWAAFFQQRVRWAGKATQYTSIPAITTSLFVFAVAFILAISPIMLFFNILSLWVFLMAWLLKAVSDYIFLRKIAKTFGQSTRNYGASALFHPYYIIYVALRSWLKKAEWKGR